MSKYIDVNYLKPARKRAWQILRAFNGHNLSVYIALAADGGQMTVTDIQDIVKIHHSQVSGALKHFYSLGLVHRIRQGKWIYYWISSEDIKREYIDWMLAGAVIFDKNKSSRKRRS